MKNKTKKVLLLILSLAVIACSLGLVACGKGENQDNPSGNNPTEVTLTLNKTELTMVEETTFDLVATVTNYDGKLEWTTSDSKVATVSDAGKVEAKNVGKVDITVTAGEVSKTCKVTVTAKCNPTFSTEKSYDFKSGVLVDLTEYINIEDGVEYAFYQKSGSGEYRPCVDDYYFRAYAEGGYTVQVKATAGTKSYYATQEVTVTEETERGATHNDDGTVTLKGCEYDESFSFISTARRMDLSYISYKGEFGVGKAVSFEFTGNNMPTVMFFADAIHGNVTNYAYYGVHAEPVLDDNGNPVMQGDGVTPKTTNVYDYEILNQKGLVVTPGFATASPAANAYKNGNVQRFTLYGPNRLESSAEAGQSVIGNAGNHNTGAAISYAYLNRVDGTTANPLGGTYDMFCIGAKHPTTSPTGDVEGLSSEKYKTTNFKYVVGTYDEGGEVYVIAQMFTVDGNNQTKIGELCIDTKLTTDKFTAGSIIAYAGQKQDNGNTTFKACETPFDMVYEKINYGYSKAADGTVTLSGVSYDEAYSFKSVAQKIDNSYMGFEGNYGVGTYMDFYFTGNNMPTVMFFADHFNGNMTDYSAADGTTVINQKGVIVTPGLATANPKASAFKNGNIQRFTVYGPNRLASSNDGGQTVVGNAGNHATGACISYAYQNRIDGTTTNPLGGTYDMFVQGGTHPTSSPTGDVVGLSSEKYAATNFKYTIGVEDDEGDLKIIAKMYVIEGQTETLIGELNITTNIAVNSLTATNIVVYAAVKQDGSDTVFKYNAPYTIQD